MPVNSRRIAKNTVLLYFRMLLLLAVSLYTSRVILSVLGVDDYGVYHLVAGFITIFTFFTQAVVGAMQRYFNVSLGHDDIMEYRHVYSMGFNIFVAFSIILLVLGETVGLWFIKTQLNIPAGRETAAIWVYHVSLISLIVTLLRTPHNASIIAHEKMEFYAYVSILEAFLKLFIVFLLSAINADKLIVYVFLYLLSTILINVVYAIYCRIRIPECRFVLIWDKPLFKSMVSFSGWNVLSSGARVLKNQGDSFFLNHYYSVAVNAAFGVASQVYNAVNLFLTNYQTAFKPQLVQSYAAGEMEAHYKLINRSAKLSYYLLVMIVIPVIFNLDELLGLWLEEVPQYTKEFCSFVLLAYLVDALGAPLSVSVHAQGSIKGFHIAVTVLSILGLVAGFLLLRSGAMPYIIAIIIFFVHLGFFIVDIYYARKLCHISLRQYAYEVGLPTLAVSFFSLLLPFALSYLHVDKWMVLLICVADLIWVGFVVFFLGLTKDERVYFTQVLLSKMKR